MEPADKTWLDTSGGPVGAEVRALLQRVDRFCEAKNWTPGYFGKHAVGDDTIVRRLRDTGRVQARLLLQMEKFLEDNEGGVMRGRGA